MARRPLQRSPASAALAVTGLLGSEAKDGIPPGTVCFAWAFRLPAGLARSRAASASTATRADAPGSRWALRRLPEFHQRALRGERA